MGLLEEQIRKTLLPGMSIPIEISLLFAWIEANEYHIERDGSRIGFLYPLDDLREKWGDNERHGGTIIEFFAEGNVNLHYWFGHNNPEIINRLCVFAKTGAEGSMAALWLDDAGNQKIVHLGSGSGSTLVCVLADDPVDFVRLLAIGYDEICWNDYFEKAPNVSPEDDIYVHPNLKFQKWVESTFDVTIPSRAIEIVKHASEMGDLESEDEFCMWVEANA